MIDSNCCAVFMTETAVGLFQGFCRGKDLCAKIRNLFCHGRQKEFNGVGV